MKRLVMLLLALATSLPLPASAQQRERYDYWAYQRAMIQRGVQAVLMCNGLFTSERTLEQVFAQELAYLDDPIGTAAGGDYEVDEDWMAVSVGADDGLPVMRAIHRDGVGCVVLAPDQTLTWENIEDLPESPGWLFTGSRSLPENDPWPRGDLVTDSTPAPGVDVDALRAASDWAFDRESEEQVTISLLVVHEGKIIHERYAPGFDMHTMTRTWSTAKSIAVTLVGMMVDDGRMALDEPLGLEWLPRTRTSAPDPRDEITLRHVLNMSSGLETVDNGGMEYATGSGLAYWAGASSNRGARSRGLVHEPGTYWDYENYETLLAVAAMKQALGDEVAYHAFPRERLLGPLGMYSTFIGTDRFGDFILSSQVYTNARDLARFGLLYLNDGVWEGKRLLSEEWIDFVRTPAPATAERGNLYGGQFWLVPDGRDDVPSDAYSTNGNRGQYVIIAPSHDLVIVRRGLDYGRQGFNNWDLLREVLRAIPPSGPDD